jgi:TonB-linked SusC/RagA family outer membrane protein
MKKNQNLWSTDHVGLGKMIKIMRLTIFIVIITLSQTFAVSIYSQETKLTLDMHGATIEKVIDEIEKTTDFFFLYNKNMIDVDRKVDIQVEGEHVNKVLDKLFENTGVSYSIKNRQILLINNSLPNPGKEGIAQQLRSVSGKVTDSSGSPLPGVTVMVKGSSTGTITDAEGNYSIANIPADGVLVFSFVGMSTLEMKVDAKTVINVRMQEETIGLEEVVAIGYGIQKKANLTGAVSDFRSEQIKDRPVTKISQLFAGRITGLTASQSSGEPGEDNATLLIRGRGTYSSAGTSPLILVDGIPSSLENLSPNIIESISILKDAASSAIYGARAANGVILVTTKKGSEGPCKITYNGYVGWNKPVEFLDFVGSGEYAELYNEARINSGMQAFYSVDDINKFKAGNDPDFPNEPHLKNLYHSGSGFQTSHEITFAGGNPNTNYLVSTAYLKQNGLVAENTYDRYNLNLSFQQKALKGILLDVKINAYTGKSNEPVLTAGILASNASFARSVRLLDQAAILMPPTIPDKYPDGSYGLTQGWCSWKGSIDSKSFNSQQNNYFSGSAKLGWDIAESLHLDKVIGSLTLSEQVGYVFDNSFQQTYNSTFAYSPTDVKTPAWMREDLWTNKMLLLQTILEYRKVFNSHTINALVGYSQETNNSRFDAVSRNTFPSDDQPQINAGASSTMTNSGTYSEWALRSFFGRLQYSYMDKYLFEANARYDGSSRFAKTKRYGFFPSFSAGWRISNEKFFQVGWVHDLKLRASWGELGNQNVGNYPYQNVISTGRDYIFGDRIQSGAGVGTLANADISWETTREVDFGLDFSLMKGKLAFVADYFNKKTYDILLSIPASKVLGFSTSLQNAGSVQNRGWEFQVMFNDKIGDFSYSISPNISFVRTKILSMPGAPAKGTISGAIYDYHTINKVGYGMETFYGYKTDGLFVDQQEIDQYATQPLETSPGDIKYLDISGPNGVPDGKVDSEYDLTTIGSRYPDYTYGATVAMRYKNFDFSVLFQGAAGCSGVLTRFHAQPFVDDAATGGQVQTWMTDRWTPQNPDKHAKVPRLMINSWRNSQSSDFWIIDASYLRIKDLQIGYNFSSSLLNKIKASTLRVYFTASNLHTFSKFYEGYDPDMRMVTDNRYYPITSTYTFGINLILQ